MKQIIHIKSLDNLQAVSGETLPDISSPKPHVTFGVVEGNILYAMCSIFTENTPSYEGYNTGTIGHFYAENSEDGKELLRYATKMLQEANIEYIVAPRGHYLA